MAADALLKQSPRRFFDARMRNAIEAVIRTTIRRATTRQVGAGTSATRSLRDLTALDIEHGVVGRRYRQSHQIRTEPVNRVDAVC